MISLTDDDVNCVEGVCSLSAVTRQVNIPAEVIGYAPEVYLDGKKADVDTSLFVGKDEQCLEVPPTTPGGVGEVPPPPPVADLNTPPVALAVFAGGLALLVLARRREEKARGKHVA